MEAEARAREAEQSRIMSQEEVEKARKARAQAEAKAKEADQARLLALAEAQKAEQLKGEAEAKAKEAEQARLGALAEAEKARKTKAETDQLLKDFSELRAQQTERGVVLTLGDLLFAFNESKLLAGAFRTIEKIAEYLQKNPTRNILIEGFTDSIGSDSYNLTLSQKRSDSVKEQLVAKGISTDRITTKGYGKQFPVASNNSAGGRQLNRRVEILILNEGVKPETMLRQ
jgi:outer membrane protein OmpA-like peptidoglycan-associated protein